jgi:hypothetical protein
MITQWEVTEMFDPEDTLTHEQILFRFKKLFNRDMTLGEMRLFFLRESRLTREDKSATPSKWAMANFFFTGGSGGQQAINIDQVRLVNQDTATGQVTIYFQPEHTIMLEGGGSETVHGRARRLEVRGQGSNARGGKAEQHRWSRTEKEETSLLCLNCTPINLFKPWWSTVAW